jgi:hypothetical protein
MEKTVRKTSIGVAEQILNECCFSNGFDSISILEPSAGSGDLIDGVKLFYSGIDFDIDCVELNQELRNQLKQKGYNVVGEDFFKFDTEKRYDYIIACPNFKDNIDVEHIMHMYKFLKVGGSVVSLTHPAWTIQNSKRQLIFRMWLEGKRYYLKMLKDNSFVENYKTQPSMIIRIDKYEQ